MSQTDMPIRQEVEPTTARQRYWVPGLSQDPDTRSVQIGLIWTVLVHLLLLLLAPQMLRNEFSPGRFVKPGTNVPTYEVELAPDGFLPKAPPVPQHFVETNPDANNNIPDNTANFGAQNQQAAQPEPDKNSTLRMPKTEGKKDFENDSQVVTGQLQKQELTPPTPPALEQKTSEAQNAAPRKQEVPLPGFVKSSGDNPEAFGTEAVRLPEPSTGADKFVEGDKNAQATTGNGAMAAQEIRAQPLPRPRLTQVRPGILEERPVGVSNAGVIGVDAHFSQYGDYLQELINIVQIQWDNILMASRAYPKSSTHVTITFRLNSEGNVTEIMKVDENAGEYGRNACLSAIQVRAPYRPWTKEMVAVLGNDQVITFDFHYW